MAKSSVVRRILTHLRFPFSFFLLPIFVFGMIHSYPWNNGPFWLFLILHLLAYPASNGYNSLQDRDTESIGGIEHPEEVPAQMLWVSLLMDLMAVSFMYLNYDIVSTMLLVAYILASRAYSYRGIRLKRFPIIGFLVVIIFQGAMIFLMTVTALSGEFAIDLPIALGMAVSAAMIGASYPLTQVYQHIQDQEDGVKTISLLLGVRGTFLFAIGGMLVFNLLILSYFQWVMDSWRWMLLFLLISAPAGSFLVNWAKKVWRDESQANFKNSMQMSVRGSLCMNLFFIIWLILQLNSNQPL